MISLSWRCLDTGCERSRADIGRPDHFYGVIGQRVCTENRNHAARMLVAGDAPFMAWLAAIIQLQLLRRPYSQTPVWKLTLKP
jgi:hypothetical protein